MLLIFTILSSPTSKYEYVQIYGMGFVGLTLAMALASRHYVTGIDIRKELIKSLKKKKPHILEPRLPEMMEQVMKTGNLYFDTEPPIQHHRVFILAVGTPINDKSKPNLESLFMVAKNIAKRLCVGDLVCLGQQSQLGQHQESKRFWKRIQDY